MRRPRSASSSDESTSSTRRRIVTATIATLREDGFAGTSARAIARRGNFNQALIFYHFGSVVDVLVSALEQVSARRLAQYRAALDGVNEPRKALSIARRQHAEDVRNGDVRVLVELIAGAPAVPELVPALTRCVEPWLSFTEEHIRRLLRGTPLAPLVPAREAASAVIAIYLGAELLDHLDPTVQTAKPLFTLAARLQRAIDPTRVTSARPARGARPRRVPIDGG